MIWYDGLISSGVTKRVATEMAVMVEMGGDANYNDENRLCFMKYYAQSAFLSKFDFSL